MPSKNVPTDKPVDRVSVSLSDADFKRIVGLAIDREILKADYSGRIEVTEILTLYDDEREGWVIDCLFIPEDDT